MFTGVEDAPLVVVTGDETTIRTGGNGDDRRIFKQRRVFCLQIAQDAAGVLRHAHNFTLIGTVVGAVIPGGSVGGNETGVPGVLDEIEHLACFR